MFTGIVETIGLLRRRAGHPVARALVETDLGPLSLGESINVDGTCLTVDRVTPGGFEADLSSETLARTTLGTLPAGAAVNLERSVPLGGRMGGHIVLGHVDGMGQVLERQPLGQTIQVRVRAGEDLARFLASKGSVAIDGVSLTINRVEDLGSGGVEFEVMLVPHTLSRTTLVERRPGQSVNLEIDVLARYVARQLEVLPRAQASACKSVSHNDGRGESTERTDVLRDEHILAKLRSGGFL